MITESGAIYALPSHYQCQGITYNKTLLEKHGWELPQSLDDLRELSEKAQQAGVRLALNELQFSGYGFQYLCNICDTGFLSTLDGRQRARGFPQRKGKRLRNAGNARMPLNAAKVAGYRNAQWRWQRNQ